MGAQEHISKVILDSGITIAEAARATRINYELLRRSVHGERPLWLTDYEKLVKFLKSKGITVSFDKLMNETNT